MKEMTRCSRSCPLSFGFALRAEQEEETRVLEGLLGDQSCQARQETLLDGSVLQALQGMRWDPGFVVPVQGAASRCLCYTPFLSPGFLQEWRHKPDADRPPSLSAKRHGPPCPGMLWGFLRPWLLGKKKEGTL